MSENTASPPQRELTGRTVLMIFIGFFGVVFAVNAIMVRAATSTFGGVETGSAYNAGIQFKNEIAAMRAQEARHWSVTGGVTRGSAGMAKLDLQVTDAAGMAPPSLTAEIRLKHPTDARLDHPVPVKMTGNRLTGEVASGPGQWDLMIDLFQGSERVFRSKSRIILR